jgi:hypothetical protein
MDQNSVPRIARSCARQGYFPILGISGQATVDALKDDPNLEGLVAISSSFPFFQSGTPGTDEYQVARSRYGADQPKAAGDTIGWTAGKLLERAAVKLPEPPTSEAILAGLWAIQGDDLGHITLPLSFVKDQPTKPVSCAFTMLIKKRAWISPDASKLSCF